jgi:hypothetical protein
MLLFRTGIPETLNEYITASVVELPSYLLPRLHDVRWLVLGSLSNIVSQL